MVILSLFFEISFILTITVKAISVIPTRGHSFCIGCACPLDQRPDDESGLLFFGVEVRFLFWVSRTNAVLSRGFGSTARLLRFIESTLTDGHLSPVAFDSFERWSRGPNYFSCGPALLPSRSVSYEWVGVRVLCPSFWLLM